MSKTSPSRKPKPVDHSMNGHEAANTVVSALSNEPLGIPSDAEAFNDDQSDSGLPRIEVRDQPLREIEAASRAALELRQDALPDSERIYTQDGRLVWVREEREEDRTVVKVESLHPASLTVELSRSADYMWTAGKAKHVMPPDKAIQGLAQSREWNLPKLRVVTGTPILHRDGTLVTTPGYDAVTQALYWPRTPLTLPPIPDHPTKDEALAALDMIREPFAEFPFEDEVSRAHNLALLLTHILRRTFPGVAPVGAIDAPDMSYGKSLLADTHHRIATGQDARTAVIPTTEEEWGKQVVSWLGEGRETIMLDNVEEALRSPVFEQVLTAAEYSRRGLGKLTDTVVFNEAVWVVAGNNLTFRGALERRRYLIRMGGVAEPWKRKTTDFKIKDLKQWALAERPRLLAAVYTLYRYWLGLGSPRASHERELASFEPWSHMIGGILDCVGVSAFLEGALEQMGTTDPSRAQWEEFIAALAEDYSRGRLFRAADIYRDHLLYGVDDEVGLALPDSLLGYIDKKGRFCQMLGTALAERKGRVFGGYKLTLVRSDASNGGRYCLLKAGGEGVEK